MEQTVNKRGEKESNQPFYTHGEEIFNAVSHIVGGGMGLIIWIVGMIFAYPSPGAMISISVFGICVITLYTMSTLYHFLPGGRAKKVFRVFDHCTIFLLIAGTYTPFCVILLGATPVGLWLLAAEWFLAVLGITGNAIAMRNKVIKALSMVLYFVMGWVALAFLPMVWAQTSAAVLWLLLAGGLSYTVGIVFFALGKKVRYFHSIWHLFDIAGTLLQFLSILLVLI